MITEMITEKITEMLNRLLRLLVIISLLLAYTTLKLAQAFAFDQIWLAVLLAFGLVLLMLSGLFAPRILHGSVGSWWMRVLSFISSTTMGLWASFILFSIPFDLFRLVVLILVSIAQQSGFADMHVMHFSSAFYNTISLDCLIAAAASSGLGYIMAVFGPQVTAVHVEISGLPSALNGLRIVQISDLHVGSQIRGAYVQRVVRLANALEADVIALTGDIADASARSVTESLRPLAHLKSRFGAFYVTGNHEYYWDTLNLIASFKEHGITPLLNANRVLTLGENRFMVAGITDPTGRSGPPGHIPNLEKALNCDQSVDFKILLAHQPGVFPAAEILGVDLQLSGHTHAGQFFPFSLLIGLAHKFSRGLYRHGRLWVYVNPGTGYWGPANRFAVASEVTLLTLREKS